MPHALKCLIVVEAGIIPGEPITEHTRTWQFDSSIIEAVERDPSDYRYMDAMGAAMNYAANLQNPNRVNWVKMEWTWI